MTVTIELDYPIKVGGVEKTSLTMRRPSVRDLRISMASAKGDVEGEIALIGNLIGLSPDEVELLDFADYAALQAALGDMKKKRAGPAKSV